MVAFSMNEDRIVIHRLQLDLFLSGPSLLSDLRNVYTYKVVKFLLHLKLFRLSRTYSTIIGFLKLDAHGTINYE